MAAFKIFSQSRESVESDILYLCTCETKEVANYIVNALIYRDTSGRCDDSGIYEYYIRMIE